MTGGTNSEKATKSYKKATKNTEDLAMSNPKKILLILLTVTILTLALTAICPSVYADEQPTPEPSPEPTLTPSLPPTEVPTPVITDEPAFTPIPEPQPKAEAKVPLSAAIVTGICSIGLMTSGLWLMRKSRKQPSAEEEKN